MQNKIIQFLKQSSGYISGEEISRHLKISRAGIWKYIQELRKDGYDIAAVPHLGYQLKASPDKLFAQEIQHELKTKVLGQEIIHHESVESTMDIAFKLGMEGAQEGTVICSETQTKGKGRLGRSWSSPKGKGIYLSIILKPQFPPSEVAKLTLLAGVATSEAINEVTGINAQIKWPNDLLIEGNKVAGILTELSAEIDRIRFVVVGVGINVNTPMSSLPEVATSLKNECNKTVSRVDLVKALLCRFEYWYELLKEEGYGKVIDRWKELSSTLGQRVKLVDQSGSIEGKAVDLDDNGGLVIRNDQGVSIKRMSGDVVEV